MTDLAFDTSGAEISLAVRVAAVAGGAVGDQLGEARIFTHSEARGRGQADHILPMAEALLREAGAGFSDISHVFATVGPGSFTGVRVGIALAKGLALAAGCALTGATRGAMLAEGYCKAVAPSGPFAAVLNAGRGGLYVESFERDGATFRRLQSPRLIEIEALPALVAAEGLRGLIGSHADLDGVSDSKSLVDFTEVQAGAAALFSLDEAHFLKGAEMRPLYLRPADAKPQQGKALKRRS